MPPSSLILAVIVAVWAAYVIQHWVRRREHVATARSVDRFSEAMRVLERRQRRPQVDLSEPTPRSYSVSLMRPAAPDVVIKRAQPSAPKSPAFQAPLVPEMPAPNLSRRLSDAPARPVRARGVTKATAGPRHTGASRLASVTQPRVSATRMRGIALLSAVAIFVASLLVATTGLLTWWAVPIAAGVVVAALAMVRRNVSRTSARPAVPVRSVRPPKAAPVPVGRRSRRSMATAGGSAAAAFASNLHGEQLTSSPLAKTAQPSPANAVLAPSAVVVEAQAAPAASAAVSTSTGVYDIEAIEQVVGAVAQSDVNESPVVTEPLEPGTWAPVPVPPPTYTLKAKAQPRPVRTEMPTELPRDGIALSLEEEFEELPSAIRGLA